jgi:hypothetical protein
MEFSNPSFLWALPAVLVPVAIHLFLRARGRRVEFSSILLVSRDIHHVNRMHRLYELILLAMRCAVVLLIVFAFAGPGLLRTMSSAPPVKTLRFIVIDNTLSTSLKPSQTTLFDDIRQKAREYIAAAGAGDSFTVYTLGSGLAVSDVNGTAACRCIDSLGIGASLRDLSGPANELAGIDRGRYRLDVFVASDFGPSVTRAVDLLENRIAVNSLRVYCAAPKEPISNAAIVSAGIDEAGGDLRLSAVIENRGQITENRKLIASCKSVRLFETDVNLYPQERKTIEVPLEMPVTEICMPITLSLSPGDMLAADDSYRLGLIQRRRESVNILLVGENRELVCMRAALASLGKCPSTKEIQIRKTSFSYYDESSLNDCNLVVFSNPDQRVLAHWRALSRFLQSGGQAFFFMSPGVDGRIIKKLYDAGIMPIQFFESAEIIGHARISASSSAVLNEQLGSYDLGQFFFERAYGFRAGEDCKVNARFDDGMPFICKRAFGRGQVTIINTSLDDSMSNLCHERAWPMFCRQLLGLGQRPSVLAYAASQRPMIPLDSDVSEVRVSDAGGGISVIMADDGKVELPASGKTGWLTIENPALSIGINPDEDETIFRPCSDEDAARCLGRVFVSEDSTALSQAAAITSSARLWKYLLYAAIVLLFVEQLISSRVERA